MADTRNWDPKIQNDFFDVPGRHLGIFGHSGVGKTQSAFWLIAEFVKRAEECIVWFDTGKSSDLLRLLDFADIKAFIPIGRDITIKLNDEKYEGHIHKFYFNTPRDAFRALDPSMINVIMLRPFIINSEACSEATVVFFDTLIEMASEYELPIPMVLFLDEIQFLAPSDGYEFSRSQKKVINTLGHNIDQIRSWQIRIIGLGQDWGKVHRGVRNQFKNLILRQGVFFYSDAPRLAKFNKSWEIMKPDEFYFVFSDRFFTDPINARFYGDGRNIGTIRYIKPKMNELSCPAKSTEAPRVEGSS
jgi:hypothetical protein